MTRYETIISLGDDLVKLMGKNLIPVHILDWKIYYEAYLLRAEQYAKRYGKARKTHIACTIADEYGITSRTMFTIIAFMEG